MTTSHMDADAGPNLVLLALIGVLAAAIVFGGFVSVAPNRLISGEGIALWKAAPAAVASTIAAIGALLLVVAFIPRRAMYWLAAFLSAALIVLILAAAGGAAAKLRAVGPAAVRVAPGAAFWIAILAGAFIVADALRRSKASLSMRLLTVAILLAAIAVLAHVGTFDAFSLATEYQQRHAVFASEFERHCGLAAGATIAAVLIGMPLGILLTRRTSARGPVFAVLNTLQTIPSLALFGLLIGPMSALARGAPILATLGINGVGAAPALIAIVLYSLLPIVRNTEAGISSVDPAVVESAKAMGFTDGQRLWKVELPLAAPMLIAGLRIVTVQSIGLVVVAALIGAGGLGTFVFQGLGQYATDLVLLGTLPTIALALVADLALRGVAASVRGSRS